MKKSVPAVLLITLSLIVATTQALDENSNQRSDVWESYYQVSANDLPESDHDNDGQSLATEEAFGTNPNDENSHTRALIQPGSIAGQLKLSITSQPGKLYLVEASTEFIEWTSIGTVITGDGTTQEMLGIQLDSNSPDYQFFRFIHAGELDSDDDGLTAWEESILGTSDNTSDSDGDLLGDAFEYTANYLFLDPNGDADDDGILDTLKDFDGDGLDNIYEVNNGTDPLDFYNGITPILQITGGNDQTVKVGSSSLLPLELLVTDPDGSPIFNAPVSFVVDPNSGGLNGSAEDSTSLYQTYEVRTDNNGYIKPSVSAVFFHASDTPAETSVRALAKNVEVNYSPVILTYSI